jgi:hypothetical protein
LMMGRTTRCRMAEARGSESQIRDTILDAATRFRVGSGKVRHVRV